MLCSEKIIETQEGGDNNIMRKVPMLLCLHKSFAERDDNKLDHEGAFCYRPTW